MLFRGREEEAYNLLHQVLAERLVVLFARSGIGKSSIINAGLMQPLRDKGFFPMVVRVNSTSDDPIDSFYRGVETACNQALERKEIDAYEPIDPAQWNKTSLWHFIKTFYIWRSDKLLQPVVIIDQFEELFTLISDEPRTGYINELADLIRGRRPSGFSTQKENEKARLSSRSPDVKVVISIREDFLADLEEMADRIPAILKSRFRLGPLQSEEARLAIVEPAQLKNPELATEPFTWSDEALKCTLDFLRKRRLPDGSTKIGTAVEPFQLQLVCQFVEDLVQQKELKGNLSVSTADLGGEDGLEKILAHFYQDSIRKLSREFHGFRLRRKLHNLCEYGLITSKGRRLLREESTIAESNKISPEILAEMVQLRLIRKEPRVGDNYYELTHDTLIAPILASRKRRQRQKWLLRGAFVGLPILVGVTTLIINQVVLSERLEQAQAREVLKDEDTLRDVFDKMQPSGDLISETQTAGILTRSDTLDDSAVILQKWRFELEKRQRFIVSLSSSDFDPYLVVHTPDGQILSDDDSGGGFDSKLTFVDGPGTAEVIVSSYNGTSTGNYLVDVDITPTTSATTVLELLPDEIRTSGELTAGTSIEGVLNESDRLHPFVVERWALQLEDQEWYTISLSSLDFDAYLVVHTPDGQVLGDDDSGGGINGHDSMIAFRGSPGTAEIVVSSFVGISAGNYELTVDTTTSTAANVEELFPDEIRTAGELFNGTPMDGTLDESDRLGAFIVERWPLQLDDQERYTISLSSLDFDAYLVVHTPDGRVLTDDDSGGGVNGLDSMLTFIDGSGTAQVVVSSFNGATGNYLIGADVTAAVTVDELLPDEIRTAGELISGTPIDGTLDGSDRLGAFLVERWALQLDQQEQYTISLASSDFDTYLVVHTPDGRVLTDDDSGGGVNGLDSTLTLTGGSGTAEIVVSSFDGNTGNYRINVNDTRSDGRRNNSK